MRCVCAALDCPTCGPAQGWHVHTRQCLDADGTYGCEQPDYDEVQAQQDDDDDETLRRAWQQDEDDDA